MDDLSRARPGSRALVAALVAAHLLTISAAAGGDDADRAWQRGRGSLVNLYADITACNVAVYRGESTALYSNRPYHTTQPAESAVGLHFCRGPRHGTQMWILEASKATTLVAFGNAAFGLESRGWVRSPAPLRVEAAGVALDTIYTRTIPAGRHVIRQGFSPTSPVILWDAEAVQVAR
jgi:hypothetical protein